MTVYAVSYESDDMTGTFWVDVEADDSLGAVVAAADRFADEVGQTDLYVKVETYRASHPVVFSPGEIAACQVCSKPIPRGFSVCSKRCADEFNETAEQRDDRLGPDDYPPKLGTWRVAWRASERGYRACYLPVKVLRRLEPGGDRYDEQRPLRYDELLYPEEAPARARAQALNAGEVA